MTRDDVATVIIGRILQREGAIATVPGETWETRWGQTPGWLRQFGFTSPDTPDEAAANYRTWLVRTRLLGVCDVLDSLADVTVDWAVNTGHPVAIAGLQRALGIRPDGIYGQETQAAVDACDRVAMGRKVLAERLRHYGLILTGNPAQNSRYARGWLNRVAAQVEALS